jgi:hypothetical protein
LRVENREAAVPPGPGDETPKRGFRRFPIRFDRWYAVLSTAFLLPPSRSYVDVGNGEIVVRMGWAFGAKFPRSAVVGARPLGRRVISRGVHWFFGRWLVNGSGGGIVTIDISPPQRARVLVFPLAVRRMLVSVDDPAAFIAAVSG